MAEVLVTTQTIPTMMLHTAADPYHNSSSGQSHHTSSRSAPLPRGYSNHNAGIAYRGTSSHPVQPYAFQTTPNLRQDTRPVSNPARQSVGPAPLAAATRPYASSSASNASSTNSASNASSTSTPNYTVAKDDSVLIGQRNSLLGGFMQSSSTPDLSLVSIDTTPKPSPDRYRRVQRRMDSTSSVQSQPLGTLAYIPPAGAARTPLQQKPTPFKAAAMPLHARTASSDDAQTIQSSRYRRRSVGSMEAVAAAPQPSPVAAPVPTWSQVAARGHSGPVQVVIPSANTLVRPIAHHQRHDSNESRSSGSSAGAKRPSSVSFTPHFSVTLHYQSVTSSHNTTRGCIMTSHSIASSAHSQ
jgi:hypothetical protein